MKKKAMMAVMLGCALMMAGCSQKKETQAPASTEAKTEAPAKEAVEAAAEAVSEMMTEAVQNLGEAEEAVSEAAAEAEEAVSEAAAEAEEAVSEAAAEAEEALSEAADLVKTEPETETKTREAQETEAETAAASDEAAEAAAGEDAEPVSEEAEEAVAEELGERPEYKALEYVTVGEYQDLPVEVDEISITDDQVDGRIGDIIASEHTELFEERSEGQVQDGDIANIDFVGKKDGEAFDGGTAEGYDLTIGSGSFINGFESGLVGAEIGSTVNLNLTFPEGYGNADLAGQDVVFTVTVNSVKRMPKFDDELAKALSEGFYSTLDGYRDSIRSQLTSEAEQQQLSQINGELMTQLYNTCEVKDYPQDLVDYSIAEMNQYYTSIAGMYQLTLDDFITQYFGMDRETYDNEAEQAVKASLEQEMILLAVAETEKMEISSTEFEEGCKKYAENLGFDTVDAFREQYSDAKINVSLLMDKAMDYVRENAVIIVNEKETEGVSEEAADAEEAVTEAAADEAAQEVIIVEEAVTE